MDGGQVADRAGQFVLPCARVRRRAPWRRRAWRPGRRRRRGRSPRPAGARRPRIRRWRAGAAASSIWICASKRRRSASWRARSASWRLASTRSSLRSRSRRSTSRRVASVWAAISAVSTRRCASWVACARSLLRACRQRIDGLSRAQALVGGQALQAGVGVERDQALRKRRGHVRALRRRRCGPCERGGFIVRAQLQALAQAGDLVAALVVIGLGGGRAAAGQREVAPCRRGGREAARVLVVPGGHRRLRGPQRIARGGQLGSCVLLRIGAFGTRDRLLRGRQLAGRRRHAGAAGQRDCDHKAAEPRVLRSGEVCEAWAHRGVPCLVFRGLSAQSLC